MGTSASLRWLVGVGAALAIIVALSLVVAVVGGREQDFPPGTPEAAVQGYLRAVLDRDVEAATGYLSDDLRERCERHDQGRMLRESIRTHTTRSFRAAILDTRAAGEVTEVDVRITERWGNDPFGGGEYTQQQVFPLRQLDGEWRIVEPAWPMYYCPEPTAPAPRG